MGSSSGATPTFQSFCCVQWPLPSFWSFYQRAGRDELPTARHGSGCWYLTCWPVRASMQSPLIWGKSFSWSWWLSFWQRTVGQDTTSAVWQRLGEEKGQLPTPLEFPFLVSDSFISSLTSACSAAFPRAKRAAALRPLWFIQTACN